MTVKILYADKIQSHRVFVDAKVPIVDVGTLRTVIMAMHEKQRISLKPCSFVELDLIVWSLALHGKRHDSSHPET